MHEHSAEQGYPRYPFNKTTQTKGRQIAGPARCLDHWILGMRIKDCVDNIRKQISHISFHVQKILRWICLHSNTDINKSIETSVTGFSANFEAKLASF